MRELLLGGCVEVGTELREILQLLVRSEVEAQVAGDLLHGLRLRSAANTRHRDAYVDCRALALEEEVALQIDLAIGDGDDVRGDVGRHVAVLRFDERKRRKRAGALLLGELAGALEQAGMQIEDVAGIRLASGRAAQRERHLTIRNGVLRKIVVDDEHVSARVLGARGLAVLAVVHEELADSGTRHGGDVLERRGIGRGGRDDDCIVERMVLRERLADARHRRSFLADGDIDADDALASLVQDGVDGDGGLACLAVADDELALAATDGDHRVDGEQTRLQGFAHRRAVDDAGRLELDGATMARADIAQAVDGLAERVHHAAEHAPANGDIHDAAGRAALIALGDGVDVAEEHGADLIALEVLGEAEDGSTRFGALELEKLACHGVAQAGDTCDTVTDLVDMGDLLRVDGRGERIEPLGEGARDGLRVNLLRHG